MPTEAPRNPFQNPVQEYWLDAWQRSILFLDILRKRGNTYMERKTESAPNVLEFDSELVLDGRTFQRPVNYLLVRIEASEDKPTDPEKRPFIVVDPRAGHGPGIGGMKADSEIGVALAAGHPCYFIGFLPEPMPGQTVEDVCQAEAIMVEKVASLHPEAEGKPVIIGNCQAGWQIMMMAAVHPEIAGPIMLAGSPLSYWAGVRGKNPMRYLGGVLGGTWLTELAGDIGAGTFDGAHLVANFESLDPANTYWEKPYNVYSKVDTEEQRFLDFETWWGSPVLLTAGEMQSIADNLFVGNKLSIGALQMSDGTRIDLRNIRSPIVVFCSWGDNITPPQQALDWITDIYDHEDEIAANGQTIVYSLHQSVGHLGIFVSGKVATKEHSEFVQCMDIIDLAPPGLYEAIITETAPDTSNPELIDGRYLFSLKRRTLKDIRALGENTPEDNLCFATAARVSDVNKSVYETSLRPIVRSMIGEPGADAIRRVHPNRMRFAIFSNQNPMMTGIESLAAKARAERAPVSADNPLLAMEKLMSSSIISSLNAFGKMRDAMTEAAFFWTYGSPMVRAAVGIAPDAPPKTRGIERDLVREAKEQQQRLELESRFEAGGAAEAVLRSLLYVHAPEGGVDERAFVMLRELRAARPAGETRSMLELKAILKEQTLLLRLDEDRAIEAIPKLLPHSVEKRRSALNALRRVLDTRSELSEEAAERLKRVEALFHVKAEPPAKEGPAGGSGRKRGDHHSAIH